MLRALRLVLVLAAAGAAVLWAWLGWQTAALLVAGAAVSASGLWEWQKLIGAINARLDASASGPAPEGSTGSTGRVLLGFLLRLLVAGLVLYGSLRCFHGSVYALVAGLGLAAFALAVEAMRLVWS